MIAVDNLPRDMTKRNPPHQLNPILKKNVQIIRRVSLEKLNKRLLSTLARDVSYLADQALREPLSDKQAATLISYIKLGKDLQKAETAELNSLSDEELARRAAKGKRPSLSADP